MGWQEETTKGTKQGYRDPKMVRQTARAMKLGIEIGGTKLQLGIGDGQSPELINVVRGSVDPAAGAAGILDQIQRLAQPLLGQHRVDGIGVGFGGPVDTARGRAVTSHQVSGWDDFPLVQWCEEQLGRPTVIGNDCDVAALAEARLGAGQGRQSVFYVTVGTGVGGGFVRDGQLHGVGRPAVAEIGHLRPGLKADQPKMTVESLASGWGIAQAAKARLAEATGEEAADLRQRCHDDTSQLTAKIVAQAAADGNRLAQDVLQFACRVLGWAIAQVITLLAPEVVIVGGGVSMMEERLFFAPLRQEVDRYVFPPLAGSYAIKPASLGETVVVQGSLLLAQKT
jgi:glucokinase